MRKISILLGILLISYSTNAQLLPWATLLDFGNAGELSTIESDPVSKTLYASSQGKFIRITNNGNSFDTVYTNTFSSILSMGQGLLYASGDGNSGIYKSTDNGNTWTNLFQFWRITHLYYDGYRIWASNEDGVLLYSEDMGDTWDTSSFNINKDIISFCVDSPYIFLGTSYSGGYYYSDNYGSDWYQFEDLQGPGYVCKDSNNGLYLITYDSLMFSSDHGNTWEQRSALNFYTRYLTIDSYDNLYYVDIWEGIFKSTDYGINWNKISNFNASKIAFIDSSIFLMDSFKLLAYLPGFIYQGGTNMFPLALDNKYQYLVHELSDDWNIYDLDQREIIKDTTMDGRNYFLFNNCGDYFRYQKDSNLAYLRYGNVEGLYADFKLFGGVTFMQLTPGSHTYRQVTVSTETGVYFSMMRKVFKWSYYYNYSSYSQAFAENLGIVWEVNGYSIPHESQTSRVLISAIICDTLGNYIYYSNGYKPEISFEPFYILDLSPIKSINATINHHYNHHSFIPGFEIEGIVYIDSAYVEYFYKKDTIETQKQIRTGSRTPLTYDYHYSLFIDTSLIQIGYKLYYRLVASDKSLVPQYSYSPDSGYYVAEYNPLAISNDHNSQLSYKLEQNYPNPFNPLTTIQYGIVKKQYVSLKVYDVLGKEVATLVNEEKPSGNYSVKFDGSRLPSGVYFYRIKTGDFSSVKKLILMK